jgi:phosphoglycerol transferase MdoB-like AlkP superfamily enzyme
MSRLTIKNIFNSYPVRLILFLEMTFILFRLLFVALVFLKNKSIDAIEIPYLFIYALRLDLAAISYIAALPILIWIIYQYTNLKFLLKIKNIFLVLVLPVLAIILFSNLIIYFAWGTIINARAVSFLSSPKEVIASLNSIQLILFLVLVAGLSNGIISIYKRKIKSNFSQPLQSNKHLILLWLVVLPISIRGGVQQIPINESVCMFSKNENTNLATVNPFWYLINSVYKSQNINSNAYHFIDDAEANKITSQLYSTKNDSIIQLTSINNPNIVTIILESWTADVIESMGGEKGTTPFFNSLEKEGLLFENIYAAGKRTDLMFPSLFSGFPAMPNLSVIKHSDKSAHLPFITHAIKSNGYQTSFNYGGEVEFANMKSYLTQAKFDVILGKEAFPIEQWTSKWGVYDEVLFEKSIATINSLTPPFYSAILTQSTHEPFLIPIQPKFKGSSESVKFKNAAYYTDYCLRKFFDKVKNEKWYNNTIFILVADHGHILPRNSDYSSPAAFRIPLLIVGPGLDAKFKNKRISNIGNQQDYAATIKSILNLDIDLPFSNNLLNLERNDFCYMNYDDGFVWKNNQGTFKLNYSNKSVTLIDGQTDSTSVLEGKSFIQTAYQYFVNL